jgi:hypothetical protein
VTSRKYGLVQYPRTGDGSSPSNPENPPRSSHLINSAIEKGISMLEWKARILTLMVSVAFVWDTIGVHIDSNWNW